MRKLDLDRLHKEFENLDKFKRGNGKTLHTIIRALEEIDLGMNVIIVHNHQLIYNKFLIDYIIQIALQMGFEKEEIIIKNQNTLIINCKKLEITSSFLFEKYHRGINEETTTILYDIDMPKYLIEKIKKFKGD